MLDLGRPDLVVIHRTMLAGAVAASLMLSDGVRGDVGNDHGFFISMQCETPVCVGETIDCAMTFFYDDDFGDTTEIREAYAIVETAGGDVRIPPVGNLEICEVSGNTTGVIGGTVPVRIGPSGSTLSGLPGLPSDGTVTFCIGDYEIQPGDPDPLLVQGWIVFADLCDDPNTPPDCPDDEFTAGIGGLLDVLSCPEDLDGSCAADFGDILAILSAWGTAGGPEDLDNSGTVDFGDILVVLAAWGPCA